MTPRTEAAVLCGGEGEAGGTLPWFPRRVKAPLESNNLSLLRSIIRLISCHGIDTITLLAGLSSGEVEGYFGDGSDLGVRLKYFKDASGTCGNLNALSLALRKGVIPRCDELLICYGDLFCDVDIMELLMAHRKSAADATLVLARGYALPVGVAEVGRGGRVLAVQEKPRLELSVITGFMVAGDRTLDLARERASAKMTDLMAHLLPELLRSGGRLLGYFTDKAWYGRDTRATLEKLDSELPHPRIRVPAGERVLPGRVTVSLRAT